MTDAEYYALSPAQKRVAVAADVIAQLEARTIEAGWSYFVTYVGNFPPGDLRKSFLEAADDMRPCEVCALGALFYSQVSLGNGVTLSRSFACFTRDHLTRKLEQIFEESQLDLIEAAFEKNATVASVNKHPTPPNTGRAVAFGAMHKLRHERMIAIMKNIVENDGTFVP